MDEGGRGSGSGDPDQYLQVELSKSGAIINVKRKRVIRDDLWNKLGKRAEDTNNHGSTSTEKQPE